MKPTEEAAVSAAVSASALMRHLEEFALRVKLSGTEEELESFRYLQRCLDGYRYQTTLLSHDAYISLPGAASRACNRLLPGCSRNGSRPVVRYPPQTPSLVVRP